MVNFSSLTGRSLPEEPAMQCIKPHGRCLSADNFKPSHLAAGYDVDRCGRPDIWTGCRLRAVAIPFCAYEAYLVVVSLGQLGATLRFGTRLHLFCASFPLHSTCTYTGEL